MLRQESAVSEKNKLNFGAVKLSLIFLAIIAISFWLFFEYKKNDIVILKNYNHENGGVGTVKASSQDVISMAPLSQSLSDSARVGSDSGGTTMIAGNNDLPGFAVLINSTSGDPKVAGVAELMPIPKAGINFWKLVLPSAAVAVFLQFLFYSLFWRKNNSS